MLGKSVAIPLMLGKSVAIPLMLGKSVAIPLMLGKSVAIPLMPFRAFVPCSRANSALLEDTPDYFELAQQTFLDGSYLQCGFDDDIFSLS
jgi:hypothetical protein